MRAPSRTVGKARRLRRAMSPPEARLWIRLRTRFPESPVFRRQHPMGPYVIDFYCPAAKLAVEIDGWGHATGDRPKRDARRDAWLSERGVTSLRIPAGDVLRGCDEVADRIRQTALALMGGVGSD